MDHFNINLSSFQYQRGRRPHQQLGLFGMVDRHITSPFCWVVDARDAAMLLPIIQAHTAPGSIINSAGWMGSLCKHCCHHHPSSTQNGESCTGIYEYNGWYTHTEHRKLLELSQKKVQINERCPLPSYLDEFMGRERHGATTQLAFDSILRDLSLQYVV